MTCNLLRNTRYMSGHPVLGALEGTIKGFAAVSGPR